MNEKNRQLIRLLVRSREDFQAMRKRNDNRIGRKADGEAQELKEDRAFDEQDLGMISEIADAAREQEKAIEKNLMKALKREPIYTEFLAGIKGIGAIAAGWIIAEYDIHKADTVSKLWQFTGLNPNEVRGKKRIEKADGSFELKVTDTMIRGDKMTQGFVAPFNKNLRTALVGVMADGFIKQQNSYCMEYYYPYKQRLENSENEVEEIKKAGAKPAPVAWKDAKKAHRDRAAKRYMIKMFLCDLYNSWRAIEGLTVRPSYHEEKLGHKHVR